MVLLTDDEHSIETLFGECISNAIVDTGCSRTVCGELWLQTYIESLSNKEKQIFCKESKCNFRFGDGKIYQSNKEVHIPAQIGKKPELPS